MNAIEARTTPSIRVVELIAERLNVDPVDLPPLYEVLDPDALDRLVTSPRSPVPRNLTVQFSYEGYSVTVHEDGRIDLSPET